MVTGEAGIGKTRLIEELLSFASRQGNLVARTACYAAEKPMAYAAVADWLRSPKFRAKCEGGFSGATFTTRAGAAGTAPARPRSRDTGGLH